MSSRFEYIVLEAGDWPALSDNIEDRVAEQWQCQGGVCVVALGDDSYLYAQAMIRISRTNDGSEDVH